MTVRTDTRKNFLHDVFVCALEGGIGYWSLAESYHWGDENDEGRMIEDLDGFFAVIIDGEDSLDDVKPEDRYRIDIDVIARGVNRIVEAKGPYYDPNGPDQGAEKGEVEYLGKYEAQTIREASRENDAGEIDASLADVVVQVGLFGKVVYG